MGFDTDVVIIGGGCNGTGLARDLSKRGVQVVLVEKGDFARGATGASSGMIHGGPRYLLDDTETTKHSCTDSGYIQKIVPHLLFRIPFMMPVPKASPFGPLGPLLHDVFFDVYDRYTPLKNGIPHARLDVAQMAVIEPGLQGVFSGGVTLDEWGIDVGRLCVLNALDARAHGAQIRTYTEVTHFLRDAQNAVCGVGVRGPNGAAPQDITARLVVNCGGPWAARLAGLPQGTAGARLRPGKGVHLIYEKRLSNFAVITTAVDGREVFVMPYLNETWIGTTDDDYYGDLDDLWATEDEIHYLKEAGERILPELKHQRLIGTRVGVRNTLHSWGVMEDALSRRYDIVDHKAHGAPNLFSLLGGKLASYRIQSEEAADAVCQVLGVKAACTTHIDKLPGGEAAPAPEVLAQTYGIEVRAARRLVARHGAYASRVLDLGRQSPTGMCLIDAAEPTLECEVRYCVREELCCELGDLMMRCRVGMGADMGLQAALRCAQIWAEERGLGVAQERQGLLDLLTRRWRSARPVLRGLQLAQAELLMTQYTGLWRLPQLGLDTNIDVEGHLAPHNRMLAC
jgi:glycerol-3-phosphate dehydrogenase